MHFEQLIYSVHPVGLLGSKSLALTFLHQPSYDIILFFRIRIHKILGVCFLLVEMLFLKTNLA